MNEAARELAAAGMKVPVAGFVLDFGAAMLLDAQGRNVELRPQAWAVLRHLALSAGRLVTKHELLDAIWPGLVVTDASVAQAVSDARAALGDAGHRVIKTVPRRGYLLVADAMEPGMVEADTPKALRTNLPAEVDRLIGREADVAALTALLDEHRLVTVLGAGGIGKTRLARAAARERLGAYADGVWWIDLAALSSQDRIAPAVASTAGLQLGERDVQSLLVRALAQRELLLVLDNCEHLVAGVAAMSEAVLAGAPNVKVLATSREALRTSGEHLYPLGPLAVPSAGTTLSDARGFGALQLLEHRAQAVDPRYRLGESTVAAATELCRRLDGSRSRSRWRRRVCLGWACRPCASGSTSGWICCARRAAIRPVGSRPCAPRSNGAMRCSTRTSRRCCGGWLCSWAASGSRWRRPRQRSMGWTNAPC